MQQNRVKKILREGGLALGTHVGDIADPRFAELVGLAGFDAARNTTFDPNRRISPVAFPPAKIP